MIPRKLRLHNFLSYKDCAVDFTGLHLAVLSGKNGDGKSALLDAMTWAIWDSARGSNQAERIHVGEDAMFVDFEFEVNGDQFAVVRKRTRGRSTGELHLFQIQDGQRIPHTGGTMRETEAEIRSIVKMDYETFSNSAFIAQGRSNEFTKKQPAQRKDVFRKLLGLEQYELFAKRAKERASEAKLQLAVIERSLEESLLEVEKLPEVEQQLKEADEALCGLSPQIAAAESEAAELRASASQQDLVERNAREATERLDRARADLEACQTQLASTRSQLAEAESLIAAAPAVEERYFALVKLRDEEGALAKVQSQARTHESEMQAADRTIHGEEQRLKSQAEAACNELRKQQELVARSPALEEEMAKLEGERAKVEEAQAIALRLREQASKHRADAAAAGAKLDDLKARGNDLLERKKALQAAGAVCPVCLKALQKAEAIRLVDEVSEEIRQARDSLVETKAAVATAEASAIEAERQARETDTAASKTERDLTAKERALHSSLAAAREAVGRAAELERESAAITETLRTNDYALEARVALREAEAAIKALGYDAPRHAAVREDLATLAGADDDYRGLEGARTKATMLVEQVTAGERDVATKAADVNDLAEVARDRQAAVDGLDDVRPRLAAKEAALQALQAQLNDLNRGIGELSAAKKRLEEERSRIEHQTDERKGYADEMGVFEDLHRAFGKDGVQALLIDQSLPRVEHTANEMLARMTGGRIQVQLSTRQENAAGTMKDTLAILISDDLGTRDYEMFSGGEAFRVDFALRIALAKLLAERSGATLPTLIIDEGFGTQDSEGIDRLVETLTVIQQDFQLILVVTHLDELKARFDRRIEVTRDEKHGSLARVV